MILSIAQANQYAANAGFSGIAQQIIVAIAQAESSLNTLAVGKNPGSLDRGILQINNFWHSEVSDQCAFDPQCAFNAAFKISSSGTNFSPWSTFTNGSYQKFMGSGPVSTSPGFQWPSWLTHPTFGYTYGPTSPDSLNPKGGFEYGTDFAVPYGTPVPALWGGTVLEAKRTQWSSNPSDSSGGIVSILSNIPGIGQRVYYTLHLDSLASGITPGATVSPGQIIGLSGGQTSGGNWPASTTYSSGPHIEIGFNAPFAIAGPGKNQDPFPFIKQALGSAPSSNPSTPPSIQTATTGFDPNSIINTVFNNDFIQRGFIVMFGLIIVLMGIGILFFNNGAGTVIKEGTSS